MSTTRIHRVPCSVMRVGTNWRIVRMDTGAKVSAAPQRFLAIARAAIVLHRPARRAWA
jgi:hypothetical protein